MALTVIALVVAALEVVDWGVATLKGRNPMRGYVQSLAETLGDAVWSKPLWIQFHSFPLLPGEVFH